MSPNDEDMVVLDKAIETVGEHWDTVHIFVTRHDDAKKETTKGYRGTGNWFARYGQIREWVAKEEERMRCNMRAECKEGD
jgi:hypothetical protein